MGTSQHYSKIMDIFLLTSTFSLPDEEIEIVYSYWDGSGHRRRVQVSESVWSLSMHKENAFSMFIVDEERTHDPVLPSKVS